MTNLLVYFTFTVMTNWVMPEAAFSSVQNAMYYYAIPNLSQPQSGTEVGTVASNTVLNVVIEGRTNQVITTSVTLGTLTRRWREEIRKVYTPDEWTEHKPWINGNGLTNIIFYNGSWLTNGITVTTEDWDYLLK